MNRPSSDVCIIGAGPCGLAVCKTLGEFGVTYDCIDSRNRLGGIWNVDQGGAGYRSLYSNTSNPNMAYADFPFDEDAPAYLSAADMVRYFNAYADHFEVRNHIELNRRVIRAERLTDGRWRLHLDHDESRDYAHLVIASGQYSAPRRPHSGYPGEFSGDHLHVHDYFDPTSPVDLRGKRVLVVGLGTSAAEVASELSDPDSEHGHAAQVILSARSGRWVLPKVIDGMPMDARSAHVSEPLPGLLRALPLSIGTALMRRALAKGLKAASASLGGVSALGLPEPSIEPWAERPTLSFGFVPALQAGRIDVRPGIERFDGHSVYFEDGSETQADVILYATGYGLDLSFFDRQTLGSEPNDLALYRHISHPIHDNLFFIGYCRVMCALWPVAEQQSRWLAQLLSGKFSLPDTRTRARKAVSLAHTLPVMCGMYVESLRKEARGL